MHKLRQFVSQRSELEVHISRLSRRKKANKETVELESKLARISEAENTLAKYQRHLEILDNPRQHRNELRRLERRANATTRLNASRERNLKAMEPLSREEAEDAADEIVNKIIGAPSGMVPTELLPERLVGRAGFTKSRTLLIPDERIEDFLESDINYVMESYLRQIAPEIELTAQFGRKDMGEQIRQVSEEYSQLIRDAKTPKSAPALKSNERQIYGILTRCVIVYWEPTARRVIPVVFVRAGRVARNINFCACWG